MGTQALDPQGDLNAASESSGDGALLHRFVSAGDEDAFARLMQRHGPYVFGVCRRLTYHVQDAEDVFQACFLELVRKAAAIRTQSSVAGWLQTVAVRLSRKARARRARRQQREVSGAVKEPIVVDADITWREARQVLEEEIARLPEELRAPVVLCLFQEHTQEEAALALQINPRTLKDRLRRGRDLLRLRLPKRGVSLAVLGTVLAAGQAQAAVPAALQAATLTGALSLAKKATLAGTVSPSVLTLMAPMPLFSGWLVPVLALGLLVLGGVALLRLEQAGEAPPLPAPMTAPVPTIQRTFRGKQLDTRLFDWSAAEAERFSRREDGGLRISIPLAAGVFLHPLGLKLRYPVRGNFDLEATFEFLDVPLPQNGWGAGVTVYFYLDSPDRDGVWFGKLSAPKDGLVFAAGQRVQKGQTRFNKFTRNVRTTGATGYARVRVVRHGAWFSFFGAEGEAGDLQHFLTVEIGDADLTLVRFAAGPGDHLGPAIDVRLVDFSLKAHQLVGYMP